MSVLNPCSSDDEPLECPLCMEYLELDDISFYPCSCGYQVWHHSALVIIRDIQEGPKTPFF